MDNTKNENEPPLTSQMDGQNMTAMFKTQKTVGLRTFFPDLPSNMSTYEKAKIWVKRHNNNYFIGWTEEQISTLDPIVRPLTIITPQLYKRHMNRSEYGRITKLKFCLESDADWAKEFRNKLMTVSSEGGFKSLGEAKIAATELWRQHSELYDVQRARIGGSHKNFERNRTMSSGDDNTPPKRSRGSSNISLLSLDRSNNADDLDISVYDSDSLVDAADNYPSGIPRHSTYAEADDIPYDVKGESPVINPDDSGSTSQCASFHLQSSSTSRRISQSAENSESLFPDIQCMLVSIQEGVDILLQRHKNNFFLDWTSEQLDMVKEIIRPSRQVTSDVYHSYIFSEDGQLTNFLGNFNETREGAQCLLNKLNLTADDGGYGSWREFVEELRLMRKQNLKSQNNSPVKEDRHVSERFPNSAENFRSKNTSQGMPSVSTDFTNLKHALNTRVTEKSRNLSRMSWPPAQNDNVPLHRSAERQGNHRRSHTETVIEHELKLKSKSQGQCPTGEKHPNVMLLNDARQPVVSCISAVPEKDSSNVLDILWSVRNDLVSMCAEDPGTSWHDKLRPHLPLIRSQLGETYTLPSSAAECIADIALITVHQAIEKHSTSDLQ